MIPPLLLMLGFAAAAIQPAHPDAGAAPVVQQLPQPVRSDSIYVFGQLDDDQPGDRGGRAAAGWLRTVSPRAASELGITLSRLPASEWIAGIAGGMFKTSSTTTLLGNVTLGGGERQGTTFPYQIYRGGVRWTPEGAGVGVQVEDHYFRVDTTRGHLIKVQGDVVFRSRIGVQAAYHGGVGGNLDAQFLSFRFDTQRGQVGLLGGASIGRTSPDIVDIGFVTEALDSKEFFGGIRITRRKQEFSLILDALEVASFRRLGVGLGWKIAL